MWAKLDMRILQRLALKTRETTRTRFPQESLWRENVRAGVIVIRVLFKIIWKWVNKNTVSLVVLQKKSPLLASRVWPPFVYPPVPTKWCLEDKYIIMNSTFAKKMQKPAIWRTQQFVPYRNENRKVSATLRVPLRTSFFRQGYFAESRLQNTSDSKVWWLRLGNWVNQVPSRVRKFWNFKALKCNFQHSGE